MKKPKRDTLGKTERLKSRKQTGLLFSAGKSFLVYPVKVFYIISNQPRIEGESKSLVKNSSVKIGVSASKRNFKKAVDRNRVKRLLREAYRKNKHSLSEMAERGDFSVEMFLIYIDKSLPTFAILEQQVKVCLARIQKKLEKGNEGMLQR